MNATILILRLLHVLTGVFWAGSLFFLAGFLVPSLRAAGPAGGAVMQQVMVIRRFPQIVGIAATLTVLSGLGMYWRNTSISGGAFAHSRAGITYGIGAVCALIAYTVALALVAPNGEKIAKLGAAIQSSGGPPSPAQAAEMAELQGRIAFGTRVGASFIAIAVTAMATARYV